MSKKPTTLEGLYFQNGKFGEKFYTEKQDKQMTAFASYYGKNVITERATLITTNEQGLPEAKQITIVTMV